MSAIENINKYNLCINMLFLSILFTPFRSYGVYTIAGFNVTFFRFFGILMIIFTVMSFILYDEHIVIDDFLLIVIFILIYNFIGVIYSADFRKSNFFSMTVGMIWLIFAYLLLRIRIDATLKLIKILLYSSVFPIGWGMYQYIYYSLYNILPKEIFSSFLVSDELPVVQYNIFLRVSSTFLDPSYYGMYLVIINALCLGLMIDKKENIVIFGKYFIRYVVILYIITILAVFQTLSMSAMLGFIFTNLLMLYFKQHKFFKTFLFIFIFILIIVILNAMYEFEIFNALQFRLLNRILDYNTAFGRSEYFENTINRIADNPLFGAGFGGLSLGEGYMSSAHSSLLTILGQQGAIGFLLHLLLLFIYPILNIFINYDDKYMKMSITIYFSVLSMIIVSMGYDIMYQLDINFVVLLLMAIFSKYSKNIYANVNILGHE